MLKVLPLTTTAISGTPSPSTSPAPTPSPSPAVGTVQSTATWPHAAEAQRRLADATTKVRRSVLIGGRSRDRGREAEAVLRGPRRPAAKPSRTPPPPGYAGGTPHPRHSPAPDDRSARCVPDQARHWRWVEAWSGPPRCR